MYIWVNINVKNEKFIMDTINEFYSAIFNETEINKTLFQIIEDKKTEMGVSNFQMAEILGVDKTTFNRTLKKIEDGDTKTVDFYFILKICQLLGIGIDDMSRLFVAQLNPEQVGELELSRKANFIISNFDLKGLKETGFINTTTDFKIIENRIVKFFGLSSIFLYNSDIGAVAFSRTKRNSNDKMREFWVRSAFYQFEKIDNKNNYNKEDLLSLIPKMSPYTRHEEKGFHHVLQALYNIGITVIVQSYLSKTQVRGGTFVVNDKPCIVITDFNKSYPHLWFALMHELYHVIFDLEQLRSLKFHLTGESQSDLFLFREDYADMFGWEMLFSKEKREFIKYLIKSENTVIEYAKENMVHPGIIYASYCNDLMSEKTNEYAFYQKYFCKSEKAIKHVKCNPWDKETIHEEIEKIKQYLIIHQ